jgi:hypothetical protein
MRLQVLGIATLMLLAIGIPHGEAIACISSESASAAGAKGALSATMDSQAPAPQPHADGCSAQIHGVLSFMSCCACGTALLPDLLLPARQTVWNLWKPADFPSLIDLSSHPWRPPA